MDLSLAGQVLLAEPFSRFEYAFTIAPVGDTVSKVRWNLEEVAGGTRLSLNHEGLPQGEEAFGLTLALDTGWDDCVLLPPTMEAPKPAVDQSSGMLRS